MTGLGIAALLWIAGLAGYFYFTTERQRENLLLLAWIILLAPAVVWLVIGLTR